MRRSISAPAHLDHVSCWRGLVAPVTVLRVIVGRVALTIALVVPITVIGLGAVDVDVANEAAVVDLALPRQVDLSLPVVAVGIAAAVGDAADDQLAVRARLDPADAEHPPAAIAVTVVAIAVAAAQALLHRRGALINRDLAVGAVIAVSVAQNAVQHLADDIPAVGSAVAVARIILRRRRRRAGDGRDRDAA